MPPLEAWERVFIADTFPESVHGQLGCISCHKGVDDTDNMTLAHKGLVSYPSFEAGVYCTPCHEEIARRDKNSIHTTLGGFYERFRLRSGYDLRVAGRLLGR